MTRPVALVLGDMDLVRPVGLAGIPCVVAARRDDPVCSSRFARAAVELPPPAAGDDGLEDALLRFALAQPRSPVVMYESDWQARFLSRRRASLDGALDVVLPDAEVMEDVLDKTRFQRRAEALGLPVPRALLLRPTGELPPASFDLEPPLVAKPSPRRTGGWEHLAGYGKALEIADAGALARLWPQLAELGMDVLLQELVPGPESRIESYHAYIDPAGEVPAAFTGRKLRTHPPRFGQSTALVTTDAPAVAELGRHVLDRFGFRGVAKVDFKRDDAGDLHVLEINPRFTLWHHLGAVAGVNIPAFVYADRAGEPRPAAARARAGATWCLPWWDAAVAPAHGLSVRRWAGFAARCDARSLVAADDPGPTARFIAQGIARRRRRAAEG
jgi:predicted ATP-grasp superfamily ATP-dependent carboligase